MATFLPPPPMKWSQNDLEAWEEFSRWRRQGRNNRDNNFDRDKRMRGDVGHNENERNRFDNNYDDEHRNNNDNDRRNRDPIDWNRKREGKRRNYPELDYNNDKNYNNNNNNNGNNRRIDEPKISLPTIIDPYPAEQDNYYSSSSTTPKRTMIDENYKSSEFTSYYISSSIISPSQYHYSSITPTSGTVKKQIYAPLSSSSMSYNSTSVVTVPESTVTTKVTGRYRAMSNEAGNLVAGTISYIAAIIGSLFFIILI